MIGRLDAPGAKLEPVIPGLENRRSPSVAPVLRLISSFGTTVTVANWSVDDGQRSWQDVGRGRGRRHRAGAAGAGRLGGAGGRRTIGLGAVTTISGRAVCALPGSVAANAIANAAVPDQSWLRMDIGPTHPIIML